jgi:hypothetical protein
MHLHQVARHAFIAFPATYVAVSCFTASAASLKNQHAQASVTVTWGLHRRWSDLRHAAIAHASTMCTRRWARCREAKAKCCLLE